MKRPSFQFYAYDWQGNSNLKRCTHEEKGIWIDIMCLMHDQEEYGIIRWPLKEIAQAVGTSLSKVKSLVLKGIMKGGDVGCEDYIYIPRSGRKDGNPVTLIPKQPTTIWYSSRMVRDEYVRTIRGGIPTPTPSPIPPIGDDLDVHPTTHHSRAAPSSSSSSSTTDDDKARAQLIFEQCELIINSSTPLFLSPVLAWLAWGADYEMDIRPVVERWKKKNPAKAMNSLEWLNDDIAKSIQQRKKPMPEVTERPSFSKPQKQPEKRAGAQQA